MATKNIVPRANNEGELGTSSKKWNKVNATTITATNFVGNGSSITGVTAEWDGSHTGNATIAGNLSASINISASGFYGDGSNLTGLSSYSVANDANNRVVTATGATNGNAEANLTFDGSTLTVTGDTTTTGVVTAAGFTIGSAVITEGELERMDGASTTVVANKVVIADGSKNVATLGTVGCGAITSTGTSTFQNLNASGSNKFGSDSTHYHQFSGSVSIGNSENNAGLNIYSHGTNQVFLQPKDTTNGRINIGSGLNQTLLISAKFAGSMYPATGTSYQFGTTNNKWGSICTNQLTASAVTMVDTTTPATLADAAYIYAKSGEMFVLDDSGNETQISPHDDNGEWQYFSKNTKTGKVVRIRMEKMIKRLEEITGESFIEEI